ncbi:MAG TPA: hypothetical protein VF164_10585 [Trueperaceae bacterium]
MQLSRTARFLIAALLLAAAAFVWVNFFNQGDLGGASTVAGSQTPSGAINVGGTPVAQNGAAAPALAGDQAGQAADVSTPAAVNGQPTAVDGQATAEGGAQGQAGASAAADGAAPAPGAQAVSPETGAPPVVVAGGDQVVTRDLVVEQLPFLVLGPPAAEGAQAAGEEAAGASRPQASQRASINPFSPVVVRAEPVAAPQVVAQAEQPPASPTIVEVQSDGQPPAASASAQTPAPQAQAEPVRAPAPRTVAPAGVVASNLPRALPSGTLPATPQILRDARSAPVVVEPVAPNIGDLAALREPEPEAADVAPVDTSVATDAAAAVPDPLGPGRPLSQPVQASTPSNSLPLAVGADPLSRYLRDNDVRFTGTVLGPLSVGVFRSNLFTAPVILTLGQALPETDIILSDLRGYEARFTQGDRTQTLSLDLRR